MAFLFVIDREGNVVSRFEPTTDMAEVEACVRELLEHATCTVEMKTFTVQQQI